MRLSYFLPIFLLLLLFSPSGVADPTPEKEAIQNEKLEQPEEPARNFPAEAPTAGVSARVEADPLISEKPTTSKDANKKELVLEAIAKSVDSSDDSLDSSAEKRRRPWPVRGFKKLFRRMREQNEYKEPHPDAWMWMTDYERETGRHWTGAYVPRW